MEVLRTAILEMLRQKKNKAFSTSEVVQQMFPEDWGQFLDEVNAEALALSREGFLKIEDADMAGTNSLKISAPDKP